MTDAPKTLALQPEQWKFLLLQNVSQLHGYITNLPAPDAEHIALMTTHVEQAMMLVKAWQASQPRQEAVQEQVLQNVGNGAEKPKGKGGWPKGKKRNAPAQAVQ